MTPVSILPLKKPSVPCVLLGRVERVEKSSENTTTALAEDTRVADMSAVKHFILWEYIVLGGWELRSLINS